MSYDYHIPGTYANDAVQRGSRVQQFSDSLNAAETLEMQQLLLRPEEERRVAEEEKKIEAEVLRNYPWFKNCPENWVRLGMYLEGQENGQVIKHGRSRAVPYQR